MTLFSNSSLLSLILIAIQGYRYDSDLYPYKSVQELAHAALKEYKTTNKGVEMYFDSDLISIKTLIEKDAKKEYVLAYVNFLLDPSVENLTGDYLKSIDMIAKNS